MCGIAGLVADEPIHEGLLTAMRDALAHRGPDDAGLWIERGVGLAHRRLSVVDVSSAGRQPMHSASGRWVIAFNGEVYNFQALRKELDHVAWGSTTDTEVIVEAFDAWGVIPSVERFVSMFAIAAFNRETGELWLARDRLGIKPLYYGWIDGRLAFGSELCALARTGSPSVSRSALASYLRYGYVPGPASIYAGVRKLVPGCTLRIDTHKLAVGTLPDPVAYWRLEDHAAPHDIGEVEAEERLHGLLRSAVADRLVADVPLGAFLSGGYDSSLVCALMQEVGDGKTRTFTIGFSDPRFNEAEHAKRVAMHLGTEHTELYVDESQVLAAVAELPRLNDEPFADASILPTFLVSRLTRDHVTVALSGDGGDELFWGYHRYATTERIWGVISRVPAPIRNLSASAARSGAVQRLTRSIRAPAWGGRPGPLNQKLAAAARLLPARSRAETYLRLISQFVAPEEMLVEGREAPTPYSDPAHWTARFEPTTAAAWQDALVYLPDDILTKVDRASMAVGLEARVPLLDHRVVEFSAGLPAGMKVREGRSKYLLHKILERYVPAHLTDRPKRGFGVPLNDWLRGPLADWSRDLLHPARLAAQGLVQPGVVEQLLEDHLQGHSNNAVQLWNMLMLQVWLDGRGQSTSA